VSHCDDVRRDYRLSYPFEDEDSVPDLGYELDRDKGRWGTVGRDIEDPENDQNDYSGLVQGDQEDGAGNELVKDMNKLRIDEEMGSSGNEPRLENYHMFISCCVNNDLEIVTKLIESSSDMKRLINYKYEEGNSALSLVCMEGHREVVRLLHQRGADIDSVNIHRRTPLMEALSFGHGFIAEYLVSEGASTSIKDKQNTSILDIAKRTLKHLDEREWTLSRLSNETRARYWERRDNREKIKGIVDLCEARDEIVKRTRRRTGRDIGDNGKTMLLVSGAGLSTKVTVMLSAFTAPMTKVSKTFAYLDRGPPYERIFAVSGYTSGPFGGADGCLDREVWTERVFMFSRIVGHELTPNPDYDDARPGSFNACHAEKQVMAFYLWTHTLLEEEPDGDESLRMLCGHSPDNRKSKTDIYIRNDRVCPDCDRFRNLIEIRTGISFHLQPC
jgi:hypothetical protein